MSRKGNNTRRVRRGSGRADSPKSTRNANRGVSIISAPLAVLAGAVARIGGTTVEEMLAHATAELYAKVMDSDGAIQLTPEERAAL